MCIAHTHTNIQHTTYMFLIILLCVSAHRWAEQHLPHRAVSKLRQSYIRGCFVFCTTIFLLLASKSECECEKTRCRSRSFDVSKHEYERCCVCCVHRFWRYHKCECNHKYHWHHFWDINWTGKMSAYQPAVLSSAVARLFVQFCVCRRKNLDHRSTNTKCLFSFDFAPELFA